MKIPIYTNWKTLFGIFFVQGLLVSGWLILIPTDTENPVAFGFSSGRLALIGVALLIALIFSLLFFGYHYFNTHPVIAKLKQWSIFLDIVYGISLGAVVIVLVTSLVLTLFTGDPIYRVYLTRLLPLLLWLLVSGAEAMAFIVWIRYKRAKPVLLLFYPIMRNAVIFGLVLALLGGVALKNGIGATTDYNFGEPPVPFLEWQIAFVLFLVGVVSVIPGLKQKLIGQAPYWIYLLTVALWLSQSVNTAYAAVTPPRPPNHEIYPFSDAQIYAQYAQSALTGNGFLWPEIPARPFYVAMLTWLHLLGNQGYNNVIFLQTLFLAFFPVLLYLLGKEIGGWTLGLGISLLAVFRDVNSSIMAPYASNLTYSKVFLSELSAGLLIAWAVLLSLRWGRSAKQLAWYPLLIGGVLGAATLIRLQCIVLVVAIIALTFFVVANRKLWLQGACIIFAGATLTIAPWMTRNYFAAGGLVLDNPISQTMTMARRWSGNTGNDTIPYLPGENAAQYSSRLTGMAIQSLKQHPGFIIYTAANHFVNNEITSLLAFPLRDEIQSFAEILWPRHTFWRTPLSTWQIPLFMFNVFLFALGIMTAWKSHRMMGILPFVLGLVYNFWTALFFASGGRFVFPLDWSVYLYQLFGLLVLCRVFLSITQISGQNFADGWGRLIKEPLVSAIPQEKLRRQFLLSFILVLFFGSFVPVTEFIFPQKYPAKSQADIIQKIGLTADPGELAVYGRAIYPRYYGHGDGEPYTAKIGYAPSEQARLVFFLVGSNPGLVVFELDSVPEFFPHASDVYMIGTQTDNYFSPRLVLVAKDSRSEIYTNP